MLQNAFQKSTIFEICTIDYFAVFLEKINTEEETLAATAAAVKVVGAENVITTHPPTMGSEDFAWMLQDHPGCYIRVGNGEGLDGGCVVHNPHYDFNDAAAVYGASYWATLVEQELSVG